MRMGEFPAACPTSASGRAARSMQPDANPTFCLGSSTSPTRARTPSATSRPPERRTLSCMLVLP